MTFRTTIKNITIKNFYRYKYNYGSPSKKNPVKNIQKQWRNNNKITANKRAEPRQPYVEPVNPEYFIMEDNIIECDDEYIQKIIKNGGL